MSAVVLGLVPADAAFAGFGHPAVITVAAVLGLSAAPNRSGAIDVIATHITRLTDNRLVQSGALCSLGGALSGFMNNVGALAMLMPVALRSEEHTSELQSLMRISYAVFCLKKKNKQ